MTLPIKPTPTLHNEEAEEFKRKMDLRERGTAKPNLDNLQDILDKAIAEIEG